MNAALVPDWIEEQARARPGHPALRWNGSAVDFGALARRVESTADRLRAIGVGRGDRVAVLVGTRPEFVELLHAATRVGAVFVPLDRRLAAAELAPRLCAVDARLLVYDDAARSLVAALPAARCPPRLGIDEEGALHPNPLPAELRGARSPEAAPQRAGAPPIDLTALHSIVFTSGSGGPAKGVRLTAGNHYWSAVGSAGVLGVRADDRWLACLPLCHVGGLAILLRGAITGTTVVLQDGFDAARVNAAIDAERVTVVSVVATMLRRLLDERGDRPFPPWLRCVLLGGGPTPAALLADCAARGVPVAPTYGLTEAASQVATLPPGDARCASGSVGRPLAGTEIAILGADGPVPPGAVGEIAVRGPTVSAGYVGDATERAPGEWFRSGDLGRLDAEGDLFVVGRRDDLIVSGGENVHPAEVEAALQAHPAVEEVCAFGVPDAEWGAAVVAAVRLRPGATASADDLRRHARGRLAGFKVPKRIVVCDDFPRSAAGKILRRRLQEQFAAGVETRPDDEGAQH